MGKVITDLLPNEDPVSDQLEPTTRRGRRAASVAPDTSGVPEAYIAEVLALAGEQQAPVQATPPTPHFFVPPAVHQPTATAPSVKPTPAPPQPGSADTFDFSAPYADDHPEPAGQSSLYGFAVYPDPVSKKPADGSPAFAVFDPPTKKRAPEPETPEPAPHLAKVDPNRVVVVNEKPTFYEDTHRSVAEHAVRFRPGQGLSRGRRNAFRANSYGIPIFSPGWTAARVARRYGRRALAMTMLAVLTLGASASMMVLGVGTDSHYQELLEDGVTVTATVSNVTRDTEAAENTSNPAAISTTVTTEKAAVDFSLDGKRYQRELRNTLTEGTAMTGQTFTWETGDTLQLLVDPTNPDAYAPVDSRQMGPANWITLSPLLPGFALFAGATSSVMGARKMKAIANTEA